MCAEFCKKRGWHSTGSMAYNWKETPNYRTLHRWIFNNKPRVQFCEICGKETKLECANISGNYTRNFDDYKWMCRACHTEYDGKYKNLKQGEDAILSKRAEIETGFVTCSKCKIKKPIAEFSPNRHKRSGIQSYCKSCERIQCHDYGVKTHWGKIKLRNNNNER